MTVSESDNNANITVNLSAPANTSVTVTSGEIFSRVVHVKVVHVKVVHAQGCQNEMNAGTLG